MPQGLLIFKMEISAVLETVDRNMSAWGEPIPNALETKKIKNKEKKLPKLGASVYGVDHGDGGSAE